MKKTQLLSIVFSLVMVTGVAAGNAVYPKIISTKKGIVDDLCQANSPRKITDIMQEYDMYGHMAKNLRMN